MSGGNVVRWRQGRDGVTRWHASFVGVGLDGVWIGLDPTIGRADVEQARTTAATWAAEYRAELAAAEGPPTRAEHDALAERVEALEDAKEEREHHEGDWGHTDRASRSEVDEAIKSAAAGADAAVRGMGEDLRSQLADRRSYIRRLESRVTDLDGLDGEDLL